MDGDGESVNPGQGPLTSTTDLVTRGVITRHSGGNNCLFFDGHVKWLSMESMVNLNLWTLYGEPNSPG
jgi:prepilin-type processing-associated H-X9-DG protein